MAAVEFWLGHSDLHLSRLEAANHRFPMTKLSEAAKADVLCFGDSLVKQGILATVLEEHLGRPVYNLAIGGAMPAVTYTMFHNALAAGARPKAVIIDFEPVMISVGPVHSADCLAELASFARCVEVAWTYRSTRFFAEAVLASTLPSCRYRAVIRHEIVDALNGKPRPKEPPVAGYWNAWLAGHGSNENPSTGRDPQEGPRWSERYARQDPMSVDWRSRIYITRLLALAEANEIPVYWVIPPTYPSILARWEASGSAARYEQFVRGLQARFPNLIVVNARPLNCPAGRFYDACHIDGEAARVLSARIGDFLAERLAGANSGARWVTLRDDSLRRAETAKRPETARAQR